MELIRGRWYNNTKWFSIAAKFTNRTSNLYYFNEYINESGLHKLFNFSNSANDEYIEVPLSEIQQYLPDGHPDKEFVLPEKWYIVITNENLKTISEWIGPHEFCLGTYSCVHFNKDACDTHNVPKNYIQITFYQFKKNVLKTKEMEEREIIGYKLKEDYKQYEEAAKKIAGYMDGGTIEFKDYLKQVDSRFISSLKKAGVLDLWFEPVFKEKFKIGDWVTWSNGVTGRIVSHCKSFTDSWSLDVKGDLKEYSSCSEKWLRLATPEEIKKTLVEEAIKRGFKEGVELNNALQKPSISPIWTIAGDDPSFFYYKEQDELIYVLCGGHVIYSKGKWAEILPNYPQIEINGYKGEFFDWGVKFGYAEIDKDVFIRLGQLGQGLNHCNRALESVVIGKGTFSKDQIKLITEYYLNKK